MYNSCDKVGLWRELFCMYQMGANFKILGDDILKLNQSTEMFKLSTQEEDLIHKKLTPGSATSFGEWMSLTDIQQYLMADTKINYLNNYRIGSLLTALGFPKEKKRRGDSVILHYYVSKNPT
jgi:hypothetical protein